MLCKMKKGDIQRSGEAGAVHRRSKAWELQRSGRKYPEISGGSFLMDFISEL